ncbi:hypothetical protein Efla_006185 [Eimeria flavescens]
MPPPKTDLSAYPVEFIRSASGSLIPFVLLRGASHSGLVLLYSHGNAEDLGGALLLLRAFKAALNVSVCCYEYTGYGESRGGAPSEAQVYADAEAAFNHLVSVHRVPPSNIVLVGRSLGTAPATYLAARHKDVRALVLISALASVFRVGLPADMQTLPGDCFCSADRMHAIKAPLLLVHGTADRLTAPSHARLLLQRAGGDINYCCFLSGATHRTIIAAEWRQQLLAAVRRFLEGLQKAAESGSSSKPTLKVKGKAPLPRTLLSGVVPKGSSKAAAAAAANQQQQQISSSSESAAAVVAAEGS